MGDCASCSCVEDITITYCNIRSHLLPIDLWNNALARYAQYADITGKSWTRIGPTYESVSHLEVALSCQDTRILSSECNFQSSHIEVLKNKTDLQVGPSTIQDSLATFYRWNKLPFNSLLLRILDQPRKKVIIVDQWALESKFSCDKRPLVLRLATNQPRLQTVWNMEFYGLFS